MDIKELESIYGRLTFQVKIMQSQLIEVEKQMVDYVNKERSKQNETNNSRDVVEKT